jgi:hypothetical protein
MGVPSVRAGARWLEAPSKALAPLRGVHAGSYVTHEEGAGANV